MSLIKYILCLTFCLTYEAIDQMQIQLLITKGSTAEMLLKLTSMFLLDPAGCLIQ